MWMFLEVWEEVKEVMWVDVVEGVWCGVGGGVGGWCAVVGAETLAALTRRRARDALEVVEMCEIVFRGMLLEEL